ncbi:RNA polymerase sigma factor [Hydrotalea sp.]|uniref:RNA polymerase sigma factor n=1 Tax=Hydrotalea sp. TaxID=2881279 RepID=UPI00262E8798|nr:RNA polymerase sigma factor [Hydrotalea sp.]
MTEKMYNQCVNEYADNVYRFIWNNLRHEEDAKDIVQSAFEKLWVNRAQVTEGKEKSYLFTIAYHQMIDHIRKNKRIDLQEDFGEELMGRIKQPNAMGNQNLMKALEQLNELQKSLVMLKDYEGYSYQEIGEITGLNESQVKVYLHRARVTLRHYLVSPENVL